MSMANDAVWLPETAQTSPTITTTEVVAKTSAFGGSGGAQGGSIREHRRVLCRGSRRSHYRPPLGPRGSLEAQGSGRAGLPALIGGEDGRSTGGWAIGDTRDFASDRALCASATYFCTRTHM